RGNQADPATRKSPEGLELERHRSVVAHGEDRLAYRGELPLDQHGVRQVRVVPAVGVRSQRGYAERLQPVPQIPQATLAAGVEEQIHPDRHVPNLYCAPDDAQMTRFSQLVRRIERVYPSLRYSRRPVSLSSITPSPTTRCSDSSL